MELKEDYNNSEVGIIPEDWIILPIQNLTPKNRKYGIVDGPFGSNLKTIHYKKEGIPIITSGYVTEGIFTATEYLYVDEEKFKQEKRSAVYGGDIVMAKIGERCGASAIIPYDHPIGILSGNSLKISIDEIRFETQLIWQILWHKYTNGELDILKTTGAQPALSMANLKKYLLALPSTKAEQTAIATALSDMDALIGSMEHLIEKKKAIKQGAMQELLRPKEGWNIKKLGEVCRINKGQLITEAQALNGEIPVIAGGKKPSYYHNRPNRLGKTITISGSGASAGYVSYHDRPIFASDCSTIEESDKYSIKYIYYQLKLKQDIIYKSQTGGAQPHIHPSDLNPLEIPFPKIEEQESIAQILSYIDQELYQLEQTLSKYKLLKQGMMQQLLTGKIRLV